MEPRPLQIGEIVQINPDACRGTEWFGGCLLVVTEPKPFGAQGYVKSAVSAGLAFIRVNYEDIEPTGGHAVWLVVERPDPG